MRFSRSARAGSMATEATGVMQAVGSVVRSQVLREDSDGALLSFVQGADVDTHLFAAYARLPSDVSHQQFMHRLGIAVEVAEDGTIVGCSSTLVMELAADYLRRQVVGKSVLDDRREIEERVHGHWHGQSQGAIVAALHNIFEAVDHSVIGEAGSAPGHSNR